MKKIDEFIDWLDLNYDRGASRKIYLDNVTNFFKSKDTFDQESIDDYLKNKEVGNNTFNIIRTSLMTYQRFLSNHLKKLIDISYPRPRTQKESDPKFITEEQLDEIVEKLGFVFQEYDKARAVLMLSFYTGMRPKEFINITRADINLKDCVIDLTETKTHVDRIVPFPEEIKKHIVAYFDRTYEEDNAFNVNKDYLQNTCRKVKKYFGLKDFSPYVLRHSFAKWYLKLTNLDYDSVKRLMGHSNIFTTHNYTKKSNTEAIDIYKKVVNNRKGRKGK